METVLTEFITESGESLGSPFDLPINATVFKLQVICNALLQEANPIPYTFFIDDKEITASLEKTIETLDETEFQPEKVLKITCTPQAVYRVRAVTRCSSSIPGHAEAVISASFSPDSKMLASGSGDTTVRFWDVNTETPHFTSKGHKHWVLCISWAPNAKKLASACKSGQIIIWDPFTGNKLGQTLSGHRNWITCLVWEPFHLNPECRRLASASKDTTIRIWDVICFNTLIILTGHTQSITYIRWGGTGLIYSASEDRTIKVWRAEDGVLCRELQEHGHWVNTLALSTDYVMRLGIFDPTKSTVEKDPSAQLQGAIQRYTAVRGECERLVSGSDDKTLSLWLPESEKKSKIRMTGHQGIVNDVKFSPDARLIASASFDKSIRIWDGKTGKFISTLRGHVQAVYQISWSSDNRLLVSGSADSTLKVWDVKSKKIECDLPGHSDEIYAVDWSPDGERVVSGGKDKIIKLWRR